MAPYSAISSGKGRGDVAPATAPMRDPEIIGEESQPLYDEFDNEGENGAADVDEQDIKIDKMIKEKKPTTGKSTSSTSATGKKKGIRSK